MPKEKDLKTKIKDWADKYGHGPAIVKLINAGISPSTAQKLVSGCYDSELKRLSIQAIEVAMAG